MVRLQYRLDYLLIVVALIASAVAFWRYKDQTDRQQRELSQQLDRAMAVIRQNDLDWQLRPLAEDEFRVVVHDMYAAPSYQRPTLRQSMMARTVQVLAREPGQVFWIQNGVPTRLANLQPRGDGRYEFTLNVFAEMKPGPGGESYFLLDWAASSTGSSGSGGARQMVPPDTPIIEMLDFLIKDGDYPLGDPVPLWNRHYDGKTRHCGLTVVTRPNAVPASTVAGAAESEVLPEE